MNFGRTLFSTIVALLFLQSTVDAKSALAAQHEEANRGDYLITRWTTEEGLPQNSVNAILQTREGYLWLGTFGGLVRFDGVKFTTYNSGNTPGLKSNRILSLCESKDGTLWIGTENSDVMSFKNGVGKTFTLSDGLPDGYIWAVKEDRKGTLWAGGLNGLARFQEGRFKLYTTQDGLPDNQVWSINEDKDGKLWFTTENGLAELYDEKFVTHNPSEGLPKELWITSVLRSDGSFWLNTNKGIAHFSDNKFTPYSNPHVPSDWKIRTMVEDREGTIWISYALPDAIYRFKDGEFSLYPSKPVKEMVRVIYEDREGNLWMGSDGGGLLRFKKRKLTTYSTADGLASDSVRTVVGDSDGSVWIATNSGLSHWKDGQFKTYTDKDGMLSYDIFSLCVDRSGSLWIGSNYGLTQFKNGKFTNYTPKQGLANENVQAIFEDRDGNLWIGTRAGFSRFRDGKFVNYHRAHGLVSDDVRYIMQARDGAIWLGTIGGLIRFKDGAFTNYTSQQGLSNDAVRDIFEEDDGTLWIGTYGGGLNRLKDNRITPITTKDGLFDDFISRILDDGHSNYWILGNRGIFKVSRRELNDFADKKINTINFTSFGVADGMLSNEGNGGFQPAGWKTADSKLWFPTIKGIVVVESQESNTVPPPVLIEDVLIDRQAVVSDVVQSATRNPKSEITLNPDQNNLEIYYTGLSFSRAEQVRFKYQMVGLNDDWVDAGTRRTAYYSYLPPGEYTFKVTAENGDGVWSETTATIKIVVRPPFWRTWWFISLSILGVTFVVFGIYRFRVAQLKQERAAQEEFSRRLINAHETERRRIAGELHDSLGQHLAMIKNSAVFGVQTAMDLETAKEHLANITAQSAQAISEVREIAHNLRPYLLDRLGLTKAVRSMLNKVAAASSFKLAMEVDDIDGLFLPEAEMSIYRIIQESLNNIIKYAEASLVKVAVKKYEKEVVITIQDNGKGFDMNATLDGDGSRRGFGLLGISERVKMLGGTHVIQSAPQRGTTISIKLERVKR